MKEHNDGKCPRKNTKEIQRKQEYGKMVEPSLLPFSNSPECKWPKFPNQKIQTDS